MPIFSGFDASKLHEKEDEFCFDYFDSDFSFAIQTLKISFELQYTHR